MFNWKGETKTIGEIYLSITSIVNSCYHIYDFLNLNFAFVAAALYYELLYLDYDLINDKDKSLSLCEILLAVYEISQTQISFSKYQIFYDIYQYINFLNHCCVEMNKHDPSLIQKFAEEKNIQKQIEDQLKYNGITFKFQTNTIRPTIKSVILEKIRHLMTLLDLVEQFFVNLSK